MLTCNEIECSVAGHGYADMVDKNRRGEGEDAKDMWRTFTEMRSILDKCGSGNIRFVELVGLGGRRKC